MRARPLAVVVLTVAALAAPTWDRPAVRSPSTATASDDGRMRPWTRLPLPPSVRTTAGFAWAGTKLVLWGGCDPRFENDCRPTRDGFAFDPITRLWERIPDSPFAGSFVQEVSTTSHAVFISEPDDGPLVAQSYDPVTETWTSLPAPPLTSLSEIVWAGTELFAWSEGSRKRPRVWNGARYDFVTGRWQRIADAPFALNLVNGAWTGAEVVLYGSLLDRRHWPETDHAVGAVYSPATDSWRVLPKSTLSPFATSAALVGNKLVAWDYEVHYQVYDVILDEWTKPKRMPLGFSECYPASQVVRGMVFGFFCGEAALFDPVTMSWREVRGGPLDDKIPGSGRLLDLWRFASMASSGEAVYLLMDGITVNKRGVPCYGCPGSPRSFWSFRPPAPGT